MRASSPTSSSGGTASSAASNSIGRSKSSRCAFIETYSPAAMEEAPARGEAVADAEGGRAQGAAAGRAVPALAAGDAARELAQRAGVRALLRRQGGGARVLGGVVGRAADLGAVEQRVDRSRPPEAGEKLQQPRLRAA